MHVYRFGPFTLDAQQLLLAHDGAPTALGPKVVETLLALIEAPGEVHAKSALLDRVWPEGYVEEANLAQNIYVLRKAMRAHWNVEAIETIPRRGYRFTQPVSLEERPTAVPDHFEAPVGPAPVAALAPPVQRPWWRRYAAAIAAILVLAIAVTGYGFAHRSSAGDAPHLSASGSRLYAIGRYYWNLRTRDGVTKSLAYFAEVIDADPRDPHGYAALAQANATMGDYEFGPSKPSVYFNRARSYAQRALALDADSSEAYAALGLIDVNQDRYDAARTELQRSIALDPQNGPAHAWLGTVMLQQGDAEDAFRELKVGADLDPLSVATTAWLGDAAYLTHHFDEAISYAQQTLDLSPQRVDAYQILGLAHEARGEYAAALASLQKFRDSNPRVRAEGSALLAHVYARMGRLDEARTQLRYALAHASHVAPEDLAVALVVLGEKQRATSFIARVRKSHMWTAIAQDPRMTVLTD